MAARMTEIVHPATLAQVKNFHEFVASRSSTLPVMMTLILSMIGVSSAAYKN